MIPFLPVSLIPRSPQVFLRLFSSKKATGSSYRYLNRQQRDPFWPWICWTCGQSPMSSLSRATFLSPDIKQQVVEALDGRKVGLILSDMAPSFTGHHATDAARTMNLCEDVLQFADEFLGYGGCLVLKFFMGGGEAELRRALKEGFEKVVVEKPDASRKQSSEQYFVCIRKKAADDG
ncbi:S-adenosyl-L-methionine-dependent methyltransferase [Linderina pennispora]|uniref:rRNA methyltransferase 2, mitochondrial n=1 Tax=Linderina pennispora TaxID=61395 RepID=A0A1Y1WH83_9FUNG|nr:S-adenosyl-L-methionine-dependent methyltransferase [Linderina pennispora]ORX72931.1 S-adenosyl-L-methionine-dependent methyltransferase [Linderina pennispora]